MTAPPTPTCCCRAQQQPPPPPPKMARKTIRSAGSVLLGILIAFFPKCPFCLAAYLSMFGSFGLAAAPYMMWLLPLLFAVMLLHLWLLFKKIPQKGYGPFSISLAGVALIAGGRLLFDHNVWMLQAGVLLILAGSLWNSFSPGRMRRRLAV